jgi:hypothetical protein
MWLAALALLAPAHADDKDAETCLRTKVWDGYAEGWGVRTMTSSSIPDGKTRNYLVTLYSGNEYRIQTCADQGLKNLDVLLYDTHGNVIARDNTPAPDAPPGSEDREPTLSFKPPATGTYYIVLYARETREKGGDGAVAMAVSYR